MSDRFYRCHGCGKGPRIYEEGELGLCCDPKQERPLS